MAYTIEKTGMDGGLSYRYEHRTGSSDYWGYAGSESEALACIKLEQEKANYREAKARGEDIWNTWSYVCSGCDSAITITSKREPVNMPACTCSENRQQVILISAGKAGE
jgi:hypothetical protein